MSDPHQYKILSISIGCNNRIILRIAQVIEEVGVYCSKVYFCEVHLISLAIASFSSLGVAQIWFKLFGEQGRTSNGNWNLLVKGF